MNRHSQWLANSIPADADSMNASVPISYKTLYTMAATSGYSTQIMYVAYLGIGQCSLVDGLRTEINVKSSASGIYYRVIMLTSS